MGTARLFIVENFYQDPHAVREIALQSDFSMTGNYPGRRTRPFLKEGVREFMEATLREPVTNWPMDRDNGAFQFALEGDQTAIHADPGWVGLVYLTPNPPTHSGTLFFRHCATGLFEAPIGTERRQACEREGQDVSKWHIVDMIGNVFNRLVLFEGRLWHSADRFFGDRIENGRLFQTFFFWTPSTFDW